jgi:hypothetical protein
MRLIKQTLLAFVFMAINTLSVQASTPSPSILALVSVNSLQVLSDVDAGKVRGKYFFKGCTVSGPNRCRGFLSRTDNLYAIGDKRVERKGSVVRACGRKYYVSR